MKTSVAILLSVLLCSCDSTKIKGHSVSYWKERLDDADRETRWNALNVVDGLDDSTVGKFKASLIREANSGADVTTSERAAWILLSHLKYTEPGLVKYLPVDKVNEVVNDMPKLDRKEFIAEMQRQSKQGVASAQAFLRYRANHPETPGMPKF